MVGEWGCGDVGFNYVVGFGLVLNGSIFVLNSKGCEFGYVL